MTQPHLANHITHPELRSDNTLYVIGVISNPVRYHSRYRLAREWMAAMEATPNVKLVLVESAFGDRHHELLDGSNPLHVPVRTRSEIWIKESMINLGVRALPRDWRYMAWIDCDVSFRNPHWAQETLHQLQHFPVVQPWSDCADLGHQGGIMRHFKSFGAQHQRRAKKQMHPSQPYEYAHSGFAWACTRAFYEGVRGLLDFAILGSADHHMAFAMIGEVKNTIHAKMHPEFFARCLEWERRALRLTHREVGFVPGRIEHSFHGPKARRRYRERWEILIAHDFNPTADLLYDHQGIIQLAGKPELEQEIRLYNRQRLEDSIEEY